MPAATWRKWYPHDIEKWNSSPAIQMLSDTAYRAYHSLIMAQWESEDGFLPDNERLLQTLARVKTDSQWNLVREQLFSRESGPFALFSRENGQVFSPKQRAEWLRAKTVSNRKGRRSPDSGQNVARVLPASGHKNNNNINTPLPPKGGRKKHQPGVAKPVVVHAFEEDTASPGYCKHCGFNQPHPSHQEAA